MNRYDDIWGDPDYSRRRELTEQAMERWNNLGVVEKLVTVLTIAIVGWALWDLLTGVK